MDFTNLLTFISIILWDLRNIDGPKKGKKCMLIDAGIQTDLPSNLYASSKNYINPRNRKENYIPMIEYTDLEPDGDLTKPLSNNHPVFKYDISLLDFIIHEIFANNASRNPKLQNFVYLDMNLITPYIFNEKSMEDVSAIYYHTFKGKTLIMPIYLKKNHTIVLVANTDSKEFVYYNPCDPQLKWTKELAEKFLVRFINLMSQRNSFIVATDRIFCDKGWKIVSIPEQFLPSKKSIERGTDFGIHAIGFIDLFVNGKLSFRCSSNLNNYRVEIRNYLHRLLWNSTRNASSSFEQKNDLKNPNPAPPGENSPLRCNYEDYINENKDFTTPFDIDPPKRKMVCLLDYSVEKIIMGMKKRKGKFLYLPMHLITPYLIDKKLEKSNQIYSYLLENRVVIMPIYRPTKHTIVLVAYVKKKIVEYYNPMDPNLKLTESEVEVKKMFKRFMELLRKRNMKVSLDKEKIVCKDWKLIKTNIKIPALPNQGTVIFDFGIYAIQFIDYVIGNGELSIQYEGDINEYYTKLRNSIIQKMNDDYVDRMNKQMENLLKKNKKTNVVHSA